MEDRECNIFGPPSRISYIGAWMDTGSAIGLIVIGVALDLYSLMRELNWNRRGRGPSGCGILPLLVYTIAFVGARESIVGSVLGSALLGRSLGWLVMVAVHISLQYVIPNLHRSWLERTK